MPNWEKCFIVSTMGEASNRMEMMKIKIKRTVGLRILF